MHYSVNILTALSDVTREKRKVHFNVFKRKEKSTLFLCNKEPKSNLITFSSDVRYKLIVYSIIPSLSFNWVE